MNDIERRLKRLETLRKPDQDAAIISLIDGHWFGIISGKTREFPDLESAKHYMKNRADVVIIDDI